MNSSVKTGNFMDLLTCTIMTSDTANNGGGWDLSENLSPGVGHWSIFSGEVNVILFSIFYLKT